MGLCLTSTTYNNGGPIIRRRGISEISVINNLFRQLYTSQDIYTVIPKCREFIKICYKSLLPGSIKIENDYNLSLIVNDIILPELGNNCNLNFLDVSEVTSMWGLFEDSPFNGDISLWNVENVQDMSSMFKDSAFNGDISNWRPVSCQKAIMMFYNSKCHSDLSKWDMVSLLHGSRMFSHSQYTQDEIPRTWCNVQYESLFRN